MISLALATCAVLGQAPAVDFAKEVAPLLERHCVRCHRPGFAKGELSLTRRADVLSGGHVVPGKPAESALLDAVSPGPDGAKPAMPRSGRALTKDEVDLVRRWISAGAPWPEALVLRDATKADRDWWAFRPVRDVTPPDVCGVAEPIDRFVRHALAAKGLKPNPAADRRTYIRRVTYDLTGLPPTPEEVDAYLADVAPNATEKLVDRLLASPRYGEQWGRHWLDVVRFGESNGFERNVLTPNVWPFRDYVIRAFNEDRPFDQLVLEHLAGDVVGAGDPNREIGTAFLVCGPYDNVGNSDPVQAATIRANTLDEIIRTTSEAFLGLTVGCARCHDHKFDPVTAADYYSLFATFAGVRHGERPVAGPKSPPVWAGRFDAGAASAPIYLGGDVRKKGETVFPASLSALAGRTATFRLDAKAKEPERRLALAKWLVAPDHPLTARVLANRVWHYHFGVGIVDTPSDFGFMGSPPTHPDLLDWLARSLVSGGWKLKPLHRRIVLSETYRQSSDHRAEAAAIDGEARLLWRFPPRRLAGEEVRDGMLYAAGKLDLSKAGGPGFRLYQYVQDNVAAYIPLDKHGPETYRRAVYHQNARAARVDVLTDFDCPDPAAAAPRRASTTTPMQALALLNHRFTLDMAGFLAARVEKEAGADRGAQVRRAFALAYAREPAAEEQTRAERAVADAGLRALCVALLNSNEWIFLR